MRRSTVWHFVAAVCASWIASCAAPSRHLTSRQVEDPLVLPRRLASFTAVPSLAHFTPVDRTRFGLPLSIRYGITDRLELNDATLSFAFLDDAPPPPGTAPELARRAPLSLGVQAGVTGFGYSSLEGLVLWPIVQAEARKHLGGRAFVWSTLEWTAWWVSSPRARTLPYEVNLWPTGTSSRLRLRGGSMIQIVDRWSVSAGLGAERLARCLEPTCDLAARGAEVFVGSSLRPRNRLDFELFVTVAGRERPAVPPLVVPDPPPPEEGLPPRRVYWVMVSGAVTIRW